MKDKLSFIKISMKKQDIRKYAINFRNNLDLSIKAKKDMSINKALIAHPCYINAKIIGVFYPFGSEIDIKSLKHNNAKFAYPKVVKDKLVFIEVNDNTIWITSIFGVKEPKTGNVVSDDIDLLIVPALAINDRSYRTGYGKAYYDRFILNHKPKYTIGIIYNELKIDFTEDKWDMPLDEVISY